MNSVTSSHGAVIDANPGTAAAQKKLIISSCFPLHPDFTSNLSGNLAFQPSTRIIEPYSTGIISPASVEVVGSILCTGENTLIYCSPSLNSPGEMELWSLWRLIIVFSPSILMPSWKIKPPLLGQLSPVTWLKGGDGSRESGIKTTGCCQPIVAQPPTTHINHTLTPLYWFCPSAQSHIHTRWLPAAAQDKWRTKDLFKQLFFTDFDSLFHCHRYFCGLLRHLTVRLLMLT